MNTVENKPTHTKKKKVKERTETVAEKPSDRQILDTLYNHYGKPVGIVSEKVKLYMGYVTPAGMRQKDWVVDGWQMGWVTVFTGYKENEDDMFYKTRIEGEGKGSWFIALKGHKLKVYIGAKVDTILELGG